MSVWKAEWHYRDYNGSPVDVGKLLETADKYADAMLKERTTRGKPSDDSRIPHEIADRMIPLRGAAAHAAEQVRRSQQNISRWNAALAAIATAQSALKREFDIHLGVKP